MIMTPPASLESDFLYMLRNIVQTDFPTTLGSNCSYMSRNRVQTDGRIVYNVPAHTQGDTSRDRCRGSSLYWSTVLVGVFFANSSDKLNMRQPDVDTINEYSQELSRLSEEDLESDVVFWIDAGEFMVSFLIVFTVFRTAVNSDFVYSSTVSSWLLSCLSSAGWNQQRTLPILCRWHALHHHLVCPFSSLWFDSWSSGPVNTEAWVWTSSLCLSPRPVSRPTLYCQIS